MNGNSRLFFLSILFFPSKIILGQHFTPPSPPPTYNFMNNGGYYRGPTVNQKHHFKIVFNDGKDTIIYAQINADRPSDYLLMINKSLSKKDSAYKTKIYPSQTKYISRIDIVTRKEYAGSPRDSCWLFPLIDGKMNAYSRMAEHDADDWSVQFIQVDNGPMISVNDPKALELFIMNERAYDLFAKKRYAKAINKYNKASD
jgi:hypothetical protein